MGFLLQALLRIVFKAFKLSTLPWSPIQVISTSNGRLTFWGQDQPNVAGAAPVSDAAFLICPGYRPADVCTTHVRGHASRNQGWFNSSLLGFTPQVPPANHAGPAGEKVTGERGRDSTAAARESRLQVLPGLVPGGWEERLGGLPRQGSLRRHGRPAFLPPVGGLSSSPPAAPQQPEGAAAAEARSMPGARRRRRRRCWEGGRPRPEMGILSITDQVWRAEEKAPRLTLFPAPSSGLVPPSFLPRSLARRARYASRGMHGLVQSRPLRFSRSSLASPCGAQRWPRDGAGAGQARGGGLAWSRPDATNLRRRPAAVPGLSPAFSRLRRKEFLPPFRRRASAAPAFPFP